MGASAFLKEEVDKKKTDYLKAVGQIEGALLAHLYEPSELVSASFGLQKLASNLTTLMNSGDDNKPEHVIDDAVKLSVHLLKNCGENKEHVIKQFQNFSKSVQHV